MSGITGLVDWSGDGVDESVLSEMLTALDHRGPDGSWTTANGPVGLGQQRWHTTPEAIDDELPLERRECLLTADARVDNREELITELGLGGDQVVTDADLLLAAYDRWGRDTPKHVVGAYAFAVWDGDRERLFCARDHVGVKPLYYATDSDRFAFASEIAPLLEREFVSEATDERAVGDYLLGFHEDTRQTVYTDIRRLPPAHTAVVDADGIRIEQYWSIDDAPELDCATEEEYLAEFRRRFETAVRARVRTPENIKVGSTLSGGLDSSSVACTANSQTGAPLPTFSLEFEDLPEADESEYVAAVHESGTFDPHFVDAERRSPVAYIDEMLDRTNTPFTANNLYLHWELYRAASESKTEVLLDGYGGDQMISWGYARLPELLLKGRLLAFLNESMVHADRYRRPLKEILHREIAIRLAPGPVRQVWRRLFTEVDPLRRRSGVIDEAYSNRLNLRTRAQTLETPPRPTTRQEHRRILPDGLEAHDCEVTDASAASFGVEPRYPFFDRRLLEFCYRLPGEYKFRNGWTRWIIRNALSETLPRKVRTRTTKGNLGASFMRLLRNQDSERLKSIFQSDPFPKGLDRNQVLQALTAFEDGDEEAVLSDIWRPAVLCRWVQRTEMR